MTPIRTFALIASALGLALTTTPVLAQHEEGMEFGAEEVEQGEPHGTEGAGEVEGSEEVPEDMGDAPPGGWSRPRVLLVAEPQASAALVHSIRETFSGAGQVELGVDFVREARSRGLSATSATAFAQILPDLDYQLAVALEQVSVEGRPHVRVTYREGENGLLLLEEVHPLAGLVPTQEVLDRILGEARLSLAVVTRPEGAAAPNLGGEEEPEEEPGTAVHVGVSAGAGIGTRSFRLPTESGLIRLTTSPFPASGLELQVTVEPTARGRVEIGSGLDYLTSVGLRATDQRRDGTNRRTSSRAQRVDLGAFAYYRLAESLSAVSVGGSLGWVFRLFTTEAPVTLPNFSLSGPRLQGALRVPLAAGKLTVELLPELTLIVLVDDALTREGVRSRAIGLGAEVRVTYQVTQAISLAARYRETHALLSSPFGDASDTGRFVIGEVVYRP